MERIEHANHNANGENPVIFFAGAASDGGGPIRDGSQKLRVNRRVDVERVRIRFAVSGEASGEGARAEKREGSGA